MITSENINKSYLFPLKISKKIPELYEISCRKIDSFVVLCQF